MTETCRRGDVVYLSSGGEFFEGEVTYSGENIEVLYRGRFFTHDEKFRAVDWVNTREWSEAKLITKADYVEGYNGVIRTEIKRIEREVRRLTKEVGIKQRKLL